MLKIDNTAAMMPKLEAAYDTFWKTVGLPTDEMETWNAAAKEYNEVALEVCEAIYRDTKDFNTMPQILDTFGTPDKYGLLPPPEVFKKFLESVKKVVDYMGTFE